MKTSLLITLLAGITIASTPLLAQAGGDRPARRAPSPVKAEMEKVDESLDAVKAFLKNPEGDAPMAEIATMQVSLQAAKQHAPRTAEAQPEDQRAEFLVAYTIQINQAIRATLDLEDAMVQKDWDAAGKVIEEMGKLEKAGHDKFKPKRARRGAGGGIEVQGAGKRGGGGK